VKRFEVETFKADLFEFLVIRRFDYYGTEEEFVTRRGLGVILKIIHQIE